MKTFIKTFDKLERNRVAEAAGTTDAYLFQIAGKHRKPSARLARDLEKATNGLLTRVELRPDLFS